MSDQGVQEILEEADSDDWPAARIAATVLAECCVESGRFNNFHVCLVMVLEYLSDLFPRTGGINTQAVVDLVAILNAGGTQQAIESWVVSNYVV